MSNQIYILAIVLVLLWAIGFFAYSAGAIIHILLIMGIIAALLRFIQEKNV